MLVLSRHRDESIMIGDDIVVTIVDIRGDKVRLGIDAPSDIPVHRQEVYDAIQRENRKATQLKPGDTRDLGNASPGRSYCEVRDRKSEVGPPRAITNRCVFGAWRARLGGGGFPLRQLQREPRLLRRR